MMNTDHSQHSLMQVSFYEMMYRIRRVEETLLHLFSMGKLTGTTHTCIGQECCAVGVISAIDRDKDIVFSNHRAHGHFIAYSNELEGFFAEVSGKRSGICGGIGGSQHLYRKNFYTNGILGGTAAVATGMALAEKMKRTGVISVVFLGDGAMAEGIVYEALNIAALWQVPILFVLEHNQYAQTTPTAVQHSGDLLGRAAQFGIDSLALNADDVLRVHYAACEAVEYVRKRCKPFFLALHTYRLAPHSKGDDFRPTNELEYYRERDPLLLMRSRLALTGLDLESLECGVEGEVEKAVQSVMAD